MENTNKIEPKTIICNHCGNEFTMSPAEQNCNAEFEINAIQEAYYKENGYELPKRCPECRKFKRARNEKGDE